MRRTLCLLLAAAAAAGCAADPGPPVAWSADLQAVADGNTRFGLALYGRLREKPGNLVVSPFSAHAALAMTAAGARRVTRDEMLKVLHLPADGDRLLAAGDLGRYYAHPRKDFTLAVANGLWGQKDFGWRPEFTGALRDRFGAAFHEADFAANPDAERGRVNAWVKEQTRDKVPELLKAGQVHTRTRLVLANAVYFRGNWQHEFDPRKTADASFRLADGTQVRVPLMHQTEASARYAEVDVPKDVREPAAGTRLVELPYRGGELAFVAVLPPTHDGLPALEAKLTPEVFAGWLAALHPAHDFPLWLPRFRFEARHDDLPAVLQNLGMVRAFREGEADFSGMREVGGLCLDRVVQQAFIEVNEEGTEAAAATAVTVKSVSDSGAEFRADRPFLFLIRDVKTGTMLFLGRVADPRG